MTQLLVTGFGPFPRMPRNPSESAALALAAAPRLGLYGIRTSGVVLTTAYAALPTELDPLLRERPDAVLMIGVAGRSKHVRIETRATSRRSALFADALGEAPVDRAMLQSRCTEVDPLAALRAMRSHHLPARLSRDAGRYLCNAAYFRALGSGAQTLFVHIPKMRPARPRRGRPSDAAHPAGHRWRRALTRALVDVAIGLCRRRGPLRIGRPGRPMHVGPSAWH